MTETGRMKDVLIEDIYDEDKRTGVEFLTGRLYVYADKGLKNLLLSIAGVMDIVILRDVQYVVYLDPRYNREFVKSEIEAAILCK